MTNWESWVSVSRLAIGLWVVTLMLEGNAFVVAGNINNAGRAGNAGGGGNDAQAGELCNTDMSTFLPPPFNNLTDLTCKPLWNTFVMKVSLI